MRAAYIELGKWGMQIDWKERNTLKTLEEMNIAYVVIMHIFIFFTTLSDLQTMQSLILIDNSTLK
jgi:hypothetical protein